MTQAAREQDPDARKALYKQAEEILVETDAVIMPLYYHAAAVLTKPYLQRTYPTLGAPDISTWRILGASGLITPEEGGTVASPGNRVVIAAGASVVTDTVLVTYMPHVPMPTGNLAGIGQFFEITAVHTATAQPAQPAPGATYTITVRYSDLELGPVTEGTLGLYWWDGSVWVREPSSVVDVVNNRVTATPNHFSIFAVLGWKPSLYLPLVAKNHRQHT